MNGPGIGSAGWLPCTRAHNASAVRACSAPGLMEEAVVAAGGGREDSHHDSSFHRLGGARRREQENAKRGLQPSSAARPVLLLPVPGTAEDERHVGRKSRRGGAGGSSGARSAGEESGRRRGPTQYLPVSPPSTACGAQRSNLPVPRHGCSSEVCLSMASSSVASSTGGCRRSEPRAAAQRHGLLIPSFVVARWGRLASVEAKRTRSHM
jgi:hypothetical protein